MFLRTAAIALLLAVALAACEWQPNIVPRLSPDGKRAAWIANARGIGDDEGLSEIAIADVRAGTVVRHRVPPGSRIWGFAWVDGRLLIQFDPDRAITAPPFAGGEDRTYGAPLFWWMDVENGRLSQSEDSETITFLTNLAPAIRDTDLDAMTSPAMPKLLEQGISPNLMFPAGQGGLAVLRLLVADAETYEALVTKGVFNVDDFGKGPRPVAIDLYDHRAKFLGSVAAETDGDELSVFPVMRLSPDRKRVLVLHNPDFDGKPLNRFSCHDVKTGDVLWSAWAPWALTGVPAFDGDSFVIAEANKETTVLLINRYSRESTEEIARFDLVPRGKEEPGFLFSCDEKARRLIVQIDDGDPRIVIVPLDKKTVREEDVTELRW
ncbi:MAG: hypothetical protein PWP23_454 [Candidatus Sumerlaeota bacterium]|nr:hypothetical protein [Candidatus Sumerlaeota bacterium]